jgi:hypothetical protein
MPHGPIPVGTVGLFTWSLAVNLASRESWRPDKNKRTHQTDHKVDWSMHAG